MTDNVIRCVLGKVGRATKEELTELIDDMYGVVNQRMRAYGEDFASALSVAEFNKRKAIETEKARKQHDLLFNEIKERSVRQQMADTGLDDYRALQAVLVGVERSNATGTKFSIDEQRKALHGRYLGGMIARLEQAGLLPIIRREDSHLALANEYARLTGDENAKSSGNKQIQDAAKIIHNTMESLRAELNQSGAYIRDLKGFYGHQTHDGSRIKAQGEQAWKEAIAPLLDWDKMGVQDRDKFLSAAYKDLSKQSGAWGGTSNTAKRLSEARQFHFQSPEAWFKYNEQFGVGGYLDTLGFSIERQVRDLALMRNFGVNPKAMFNKLTGDLARPEQIKLTHYFEQLTGEANDPVNHTVATVGRSIRSFQSMSKLGGALFSYIGDLPSKIVELERQGAGIFQAINESLRPITGRLSREEADLMRASLGVGMEGRLGAFMDASPTGDNIPGRISQAMRLFFKLNLQYAWTNANKIGTASFMTHALAAERGKTYGELPEYERNFFNQYGINPDDWDAIRTEGLVTLEGGREHLMPDNIKDTSIANKLRTYIVSRVDYATVTQGAKQTATMTGGLHPGDWKGEGVRLLTQLLSYPVTYISKVWGPLLYHSGKADVPLMLHLVIGATLAGYAGNALRDLARGKEPAMDAEAIGQAFLKGGAGGLFADLTMGYLINGNERDYTSAIAGPTVGTVNDIAEIARKVAHGEPIGNKGVKLLTSNVPGNNLFYIRPILDYAFLNQMMEASSPGWGRRVEKYYRDDRGQEYLVNWMRPSSQLQYDVRK